MRNSNFVGERRLVPVVELPFAVPTMHLTESKVRWWIYKQEKNGFGRCLRRIGSRRLFVDLDEFFRWIDQQSSIEHGVESAK